MNSQVSGHHNDSGSGAQGAVGVRDLDVNADGSRLVAIGNFKRVDGLLRDQMVMISLSDASTGVTADWATTRYSPYCFNFAFDTYMRGVSFSPDGSYLVVTATGGYVANTLCDTAARFETSATGADVQPTWVDYTGGDTLWSNTITEKAVYVGGHQRWLNNSLAGDTAGPGAVPRPGLAALDPNTGVPMKWNPGRNPRGAAVYALYATPTGLWMGSDTEYIGNHYQYKRPRLAFFPLAGGAAEASDTTPGLPGNGLPRCQPQQQQRQHPLPGERRRTHDRCGRQRAGLGGRQLRAQPLPQHREQHLRERPWCHDRRHRSGDHSELGVRHRALGAR